MSKEPNKKNKRVSKSAVKKVVQDSYDNKQIETLIDKTKIKNKQRKNKIRFYYSFLTIVLLICLAQIGFSAILNISKTISYQTKINTIKKTKDQADKRNKQLKQEIQNFSSASSLEAIARNNLKMAGENEVLVIINTAQEASSTVPVEKKNKKHVKKVKNEQ